MLDYRAVGLAHKPLLNTKNTCNTMYKVQKRSTDLQVLYIITSFHPVLQCKLMCQDRFKYKKNHLQVQGKYADAHAKVIN